MAAPAQPSPIFTKLKSKLQDNFSSRLYDIIDLRQLGLTVTQAEKAQLHNRVERLASRTLRGTWQRELTPAQREQLVDEVLEEALGLGPLEPLMHDPSVSEIMINGPSLIFVERRGRLEHADCAFRDADQLLTIIERLLSTTGRRASMAEPSVDARLADGSRITVALPPIALHGPFVTIRKFSHEVLTLETLIRLRSLTTQAAEFLRLCVRGRLNLVISGPGSSGKTTLLNALAVRAIQTEERMVLIEDTAELVLPAHHVVRLETRPPSVEGRGEVTVRHLLNSALHMRPDRILIGEVRGEEALDMLQALNTGHNGSMTTLHANTPFDVLDRISTMALMSRLTLSPIAIERQIRSAIDLIVHTERFSDGTRKVTHVSEVRKGSGRKTALADLFTLSGSGPDAWGALRPTGAQPALLERLARRGVPMPTRVWNSV